MGVCSGGAKSISNATNTVPTNSLVSGGVGGGEVDVVGGDDEGNLYIGRGGAVAKVEGGEIGAGQLVAGGVTEDGIITSEVVDVIGGGGGEIIGGGAGPSFL